MPSAKCKLCGETVPSFEKLKLHWWKLHPHQYLAVKTWVSDMDKVMVEAEALAKEGLKGHWAGREEGPGAEEDPHK